MRVNLKHVTVLLMIASLVFIIWQYYPTMLFKVSEWQKQFNLELSASLKNLKNNTTQAGMSLLVVSFLYGVFHAVGPGHGKFILTGYLSFEQTKLPQAIKITLLSAFVQGIVAIALVSILVVIFTLSRQYFNLTLKWVERGSFLIMIAFGCYWIWQVWQKYRLNQASKRLKIRKILQISEENRPLAPRFFAVNHVHSENCGCGHRHLPSSQEIEQAQDLKSLLMLVFSIGLRPCTGAILVLFLAYTLDLYAWGVFSALAMALGTGLTLSLFAWFVLFARNRAVKLGRWYLSFSESRNIALVLKLIVAGALLVLGITLFHSSLIDTSTNLLFKR